MTDSPNDATSAPSPSPEPTATSASDPTGGASWGPPDGSTPAGSGPAGTRTLVRDPTSRLGGVASGLSHYLGVDVSLIRVAFVLLTPFSGIGVLIYIVAWLVIPRAEHWPPTGIQPTSRSFSSRQVAIGLIGVVLAIVLLANGGFTARLLVSTALLAGGVWLLRQPEAPASPSTPAPGVGPTWMPPPSSAPADVAVGGEPSPFSTAEAAQPSDVLVDELPVTGPSAPDRVGSPPPRPRRRWGRVVALLVFLAALPIAAIIVAVTLFATGVVDIDSGFEAVYRPVAVEEIPETIRHDTGRIELDLTAFDLEELRAAVGQPGGPEAIDPISIDVAADVGQLRVIVPEDLVSALSVDAHVGVGEVKIFGSSEGGLGSDLTVAGVDQVIELELDLGVGQITVEQR